MRVGRPSFGFFVISLLLFILVILSRYFGFAIPVISGNSFEVLLVAYALMLVSYVAS